MKLFLTMSRKDQTMMIGYPKTRMVNTQNGQNLSPSHLLFFNSNIVKWWIWGLPLFETLKLNDDQMHQTGTSVWRAKQFSWLRIDLFLVKTSKQCHIWNTSWSNFWGKFLKQKQTLDLNEPLQPVVTTVAPTRRKQRWSFSPGYSFVEEGQRFHPARLFPKL